MLSVTGKTGRARGVRVGVRGLAGTALAVLAGCGGSGSDPVATHAVGGALSGLASGVELTLQNNAGDDLVLRANGSFVFATPVAEGGRYAVTVTRQPAGQRCSVSRGSGTLQGPVSDIVVSCQTLPANTYTVGGSLSGLAQGATLVVQNNGGDDLSLSASGGFTFATPLASGAGYAVSVKVQPAGQQCTVGGATGVVSAAVSSVKITCADVSPPANAGWRERVPVSGYGAGSVQIAVDDAGNALAVWTQQDPGVANDSLWGSRFTPAGGWATPQRLEEMGGTVKGDAVSLAMDRVSGRAVLAWLQLTSSKYDVWARDFDPASGWSGVVPLESADENTGSVSAGIDGSGNAVVAWSQAPLNGRYSIWASRLLRGNGWGARQLLESNDVVGGVDVDPVVAVARNGDAFVVWRNVSNDALGGLWANRFAAGGGWGTARRLVAKSEGFARSLPTVVADASGNAVMAWGRVDVDGSGTWNTIYTLRYQGGWQSTPVAVAPRQSVVNTVSMPALASNAQGALVVAWGLPDSQTLYAASAAAGAGWSAPASLKAADGQPLSGAPQVGVDEQGNAVAAWTQGGKVVARLYRPGSGWAAPSVSETARDNTTALAVNGRGDAWLAWTNWVDGSGTQIVARRYVSGR